MAKSPHRELLEGAVSTCFIHKSLLQMDLSGVKENAGLALSEGTKWPLWASEFNLLVACQFAHAGKRRKEQARGRAGENYDTENHQILTPGS